MTLLADLALDAALNYVKDNAGALHICSQEPATYTEATSTYTLGNKASPAFTGPADASPNGRKITRGAITDGTVTSTNTATHEALVKTSATAGLLTTKALSAPQAVTSGNTFTLTAQDIRLPDAS